jgi:hypothetical protein
MQSERVQICSRKLLQKGFCASWFVPLQTEASVDDIPLLFAKFMMSNEETDFPLLNAAFATLKNNPDDCMFVFMRRYTTKALGILRSNKPMYTPQEKRLLQQLGQDPHWNVPVWTWTESDHRFEQTMEEQCRNRRINGHCMGLWCYR